MPKRIGNTQTPSINGLTDIINLKQHKNFVEQGIFPSTDNHVVNSLRFDGGSYLSRNMSGTGQAKWTFSFWVKRSADGTNYLIGESYSSHDGFIGFDSTDTITFLDKYCSGGCKTNLTTTNTKFRDFNSFYHVVCTFNGSESTVSDGFKIYINGQLMTSNAAADQWPRNSTGWFLGTMYIGRSYSANYLRGYMAELNFIDGQELTPTDFGYYNRSTSQWKPKKYTGTYGANGFLLEFKDSSNVGKDTSGNGNDWTSTGFVSSDNVTDSPHNTFATLANTLQHDATSSAVSDGNLKYLEPSNSLDHADMSNAIANFSATSGKKWYWEVVIFNTIDSNQRIASNIGVILQQNDTQGNTLYSTDYFNGTCYAWGNDTTSSTKNSSTGVYQRNGSTLNTVSSPQASYLIHGTVVGVLLDLESSPNTLTLYANGSEL